MKALVRLLAVIRELTGEVLLSLLLGVAAITAGIGLLGTSAYLIASAALKPSIADLQVAIVGVRFFGISRGVFRYLERLVSHSVNLRVLSRLREDFYRRVEPGAPANLAFHRSGDVLERVMGDLETLENFYVRVISPVVVALVITTGVSLFVGGYASQLGLILAVGLVTGGFIHPAISMLVSRKHLRALSRSKSAASARIVETLQGLEDIQVCNAHERFFGPLLDDFQRSGELQQRLVTISASSSGLSLLITNLTVLGLLWVAIPLVGAEGFNGISLAVVLLVALASFEAVLPMPAASLNFNASATAAGRLFSIGENRAAPLAETRAPDGTAAPVVLFENVNFSYATETAPVLTGIDLALSPGRKVAIVGASGAGKTSLLNLLLSFEHPQSGRISIGGMDLRDTNPDWSRNWFAVMPQSVYLFNDTLRANLLLAKPDAADEALVRALRNVDLGDWFNALPLGLDTWIGEHGMKMSGGERQRLALARTLLQDRPFIVFDEPTANLDRVTSRKVMNALFSILASKGMLIITYDMDLLREMDEIVVLGGGRITQRGTFDELSTIKGDFRNIFVLESDKLSEI